MWRRIRREMMTEYYWLKRHSAKKWRLDSPGGFMGILLIVSGIILMTLVGQAFAAIFRHMIPLVAGTEVSSVYWSSIIFALKMSLAFIIFSVALIGYLFFRFTRRKY